MWQGQVPGTRKVLSTVTVFLITIWVLGVMYTPIAQAVTAKDITGFVLAEQTGPAVIDAENHTVTAEVYGGTDITSLTPEISVSDGATVSPGSGEPQNFSTPVTYTVTAGDGSRQEWVVIVLLAGSSLSDANDITGFILAEQTGTAVINTENHTVTVEVARGTDLSNLAPGITVSPGATINPGSGEARDFTNPVTYTVTAADGSQQVWVVTVTEAAGAANDITGFVLAEQVSPAVIDTVSHTVTVEVTSGTDLSSLTPEIAVSPGATVSPASGEAQDFTGPVTYIVTAADGSQQAWVVTVTEIAGDAKEITGFVLAEQTSPAVIDAVNHTVTVEVSYGTDLSVLKPVITVSPGASISPASGEAQDFTNPVTYTVTAADESTQKWIVTVTEAGPGEAPEIIWERKFGGAGNDIANCVIQLKDGGYVIAGSSDNDTYAYLVKTDAFGDVVWEQKFGGYGTTVGNAVYETTDGGLIVAGYRKATITSNDKVYLLKTDASGNQLWEQSISIPYTKCKAYAVQETNDGGYIIAGSTLSGGQTDVYLVKTDASGNTQWERTYGGLGWDVAYSVRQTSDGGYILAGYMEGASDDVYLIKTDANGIAQWQQTFGSPTGKEQAKQVSQTSDGGYILAGHNETYDYWLIKTDPYGNQSWNKAFDYGTGIAYSVEQTRNNGYVMAGSAGGKGIYLVQTDDSGEKLWEKNIGTGTDTVYSILQNPDGDYIAAGVKDGDAYLVCLGKIKIKIDAAAEYDSINKKLNIKATAACPADGVMTSLDDSNTSSANYELLDVQGNPLGVKGNLVYNRDTLQWEALDFDVSAFNDQMLSLKITFKDKHDHSGSTIIFTQKARLILSTPQVIPGGGYVHIYAMAFNDNGELITGGDAQFKIEITGYAENIALNDSGIEGWDVTANDGVYSCPPQHITEPVTVDLYLGDQKVDSRKIGVAPYPELAVVTDIQVLHDEFVDTGMVPGEDRNNNNLVDFYELIDRLSNYAADHHGVVFDLRSEITTDHGYTYDYRDCIYDNDSDWMGAAIDELVKTIGDATGNSFKNIAIIGDDEVVPFFRRSSFTFNGVSSEADYPKDMGGDKGNRTLVDSGANYIMTDIPYANFDNNGPDFVFDPKPDMGLGRIFAPNPVTLINNINAYEGSIDVSALSSSASLFNVPNDSLYFEDKANQHLSKILSNHYFAQRGNVGAAVQALPGHYYWYNGAVYPWANELAQAINSTDINLLWTHADHISVLTALKDDVGDQAWFFAGDYDSALASGKLFISLGCHSGYSVSHQSTENDFSAYNDALVNKLLEKQVAYLAPTTYGITWVIHEPGYHEMLLQKFLVNVLDASTKTVGDALVKAYNDFWSTVPPDADPNINTYATYGLAFYGLPTQGISHSAADLPAGGLSLNTLGDTGRIVPLKAAAAGSPRSAGLSFIVDVPNFKVSKDDNGRALFEVPYGGSLFMEPFAPAMPMVVKTFTLPAGAEVKNVSISNQATSKYYEQVDIVPSIPVNLTTGPIEGSFAASNPYPKEIFWWNAYEHGGKVVLTICVVPMQYNPDTREVTMYNHLEFNVDYTSPAQVASIESVIVNNNQVIGAGDERVPVALTLSSRQDKEVNLYWAVKDSDGLNLTTGLKNVYLRSGSNQAQFTLNTVNWGSGAKGLTVTIADTAVLDAINQDILVEGINLNVQLSKNNYSVSDINGVLKVEVTSEQGEPVSGLTVGNFSLSLDGAGIAIAHFAETSPGIYRVQFTLSDITAGIHLLSVVCEDNRGLKKTVELNFQMGGTSAVTPYVPPTITSSLGTSAVVGEENSFRVSTLLTKWTKINAETVGRATYTVEGLVPGVEHSFAVSAVDQAGQESGLSNRASANLGPVTISSNLGSALQVGTEEIFQVTTMVSEGQGRLVRVKVTLANASLAGDITLSYKELAGGQYYPLIFDANGITWYGPSDGFPLANATSDFKIIFSTEGIYRYTLEVIDQATGNVLASTSNSVVVTDESIPPYKAPVISSNLGSTAKVNEEQIFQVNTKANSEAAKLVLMRVVLDDPGWSGKVNLHYKDSIGYYSRLLFDAGGTAWYGPPGGFLLADATNDFKVTFTAKGTYRYTLELVEQTTGNVLAQDSGSIVVSEEVVQPDVDVSGVSLNKASIKLQVGHSTGLVATIKPPNATNQSVTWQSDNPAVASVAGSGLNATVTAKSQGTAVITVKTVDGGYTASCQVEVTTEPVPSSAKDITSFVLAEQTGAATIDTVNHTVKVEVKHGTDLSNLTPSIAVSPKASISPASGVARDFTGPVEYTVTAEDGTKQTWTVIVTEADPPSSGVDVTGVSLNKASIKLQVGDSTILSAIIRPSNATNQSVIWQSDNPAVASVAGSGLNATVTAESQGTATITVQTVDGGFTASCRVEVTTEPVLSSANEITGFVLADQTGAATIDPVNHTVKVEVKHGTGLSNLAPTITVSAGASISPASGVARDFTGPVEYTVTAEDGTKQTWTVTVTVADPPSTPPAGGGGGGGGGGGPGGAGEGAGVGAGGDSFIEPKIIEYVPAENEKDADLISFIFTCEIEGIDLDRIYVIDEAGNKVSGSTVVINGEYLTIINDSFKYGTTYTLVVPQNTVKKKDSSATNKEIRWSFTTEKLRFADVPPTHWAADVIYELSDNGFISGYPDRTFRPNQAITRAEFTRVLTSALGLTKEQPATPTFVDVKPGDWFYGCVETAAGFGLVKGYGNGEFRPNKSITRQEIAAILVRVMGTVELDAGSHTSFKDNGDIAPWAIRSVVAATQKGFVRGYSDNTFRPENNATRAETCAMIKRLLDLKKQNAIE